MKHFAYLIAAAWTMAGTAQAQMPLSNTPMKVPELFQKKLSAHQLTIWTIPGFKTHAPKGIKPMAEELDGHDFAMKHDTKAVELRYSVRPFPKKEDVTATNPSIKPDSQEALSVMLYKIASAIGGSKGQIVRPTPFPERALKKELGADYGERVIVKSPGNRFAHGYNEVLINGFYRKGIGHSFVIVLYRNQKDYAPFSKQVFHSLTYKVSCTKEDPAGCIAQADVTKKTDLAAAKELYRKACDAQLWEGCSEMAELEARDKRWPEAEAAFKKACENMHGRGCMGMVRLKAVRGDRAQSVEYLKKACDAKVQAACRKLKRL